MSSMTTDDGEVLYFDKVCQHGVGIVRSSTELALMNRRLQILALLAPAAKKHGDASALPSPTHVPLIHPCF